MIESILDELEKLKELKEEARNIVEKISINVAYNMDFYQVGEVYLNRKDGMYYLVTSCDGARKSLNLVCLSTGNGFSRGTIEPKDKNDTLLCTDQHSLFKSQSKDFIYVLNVNSTFSNLIDLNIIN